MRFDFSRWLNLSFSKLSRGVRTIQIANISWKKQSLIYIFYNIWGAPAVLTAPPPPQICIWKGLWKKILNTTGISLVRKISSPNYNLSFHQVVQARFTIWFVMIGKKLSDFTVLLCHKICEQGLSYNNISLDEYSEWKVIFLNDFLRVFIILF